MSTQNRGSRPDERASRILARSVPFQKGFVQTYGDIESRAPRLVGHVLVTAPDDVPWHAVVRADGSVPLGRTQLPRLRKEYVPLRGDRVELPQARWEGSSTIGPPVV